MKAEEVISFPVWRKGHVEFYFPKLLCSKCKQISHRVVVLMSDQVFCTDERLVTCAVM